MPYSKTTWVDGVTKVGPTNLNNIESGIADAPYGPDASASQVPVWNGTSWGYQTVPGADTVRATRGTTQAVATATWTLINFDSEDWDTNALHDTVTNPDRLTCKTAGKYLWSFGIKGDNKTTGIRAVQVQKNSESLPGTGDGGVFVNAPGTAVSQIWSASGQVSLAVNDYLCVVTFQNSGSSINLDVGSWFAMTLISTS